MAYSSSNLRMIAQAGFLAQITGGGAIWLYSTSDASSDVSVTGYFARAGAGSKSPPSQAADNVGMRVGDIVIVSNNSGAVANGRTTIHTVTGSTANQSSTSASTGATAGYDVTISSTP